MARLYSPKQFFRLVPNKLLAQYFQQKHEVLLDFAFDEIKKVEVDAIFQAYKTLPEEVKTKVDSELWEIHVMACPGGVTTLIDESDHHGDDAFAENISKKDGFYGKVMWAFLEHQGYWEGATLFYHSDNISDSYWKKRSGINNAEAHVAEEDVKLLENAISSYFYSKEGRGRHCMIDVFPRRKDKFYFFAYSQDFAQSDLEWVQRRFSIRTHNPVFEIIFVYKQSEGELDIYAPRNTKSVPALQDIFAKTILKLDGLDEDEKDNRVYSLDALADKDFDFNYTKISGIKSVSLILLRLSLIGGNKRRITLEADQTSGGSKAIYELLGQIRPHSFHVTQVKIKVNFHSTPTVKEHPRIFTITIPNSCSLHHSAQDLIIRDMLAQSDLDKKEPKDKNNNG